MKTMKKAMSLLLAIVMLIAMLPTGVFAAYQDEFSDFPTGWSKVAMEAAVDNGLLKGFVDGTIKPEANLTRAEMAAIITRAFNAKTKADISAFVDVNPDAWYYDYIAKAVKMGALNGKSSSMMYPDTPITREEVFTAVARVLVLSSENTSALNRYNDKEDISAWALKSMSALAERGYVNGDDLGNSKPKANITREEFAQFMYNTIRTYITKEGTYTKDLEGITVLRVGNVILENFDNTSDLVLGDGVGEDPVRITNVNVEKRLLTRGGRITLQNTTVTEGVVVNNVNGITYFNNYRTESVFDGIIENTEARFKEKEADGGTVIKTYPVTFDVDGNVTTKTIRKGATIGSKFPDAPIGYIITGWQDENGTPVTADTVVTGPMMVIADWEYVEYDLSFVDKDGNTFAPDDSFNIGDTNILPDPADVDMSGYPGYSFAGWKDADTGVTVAGDADLKNLLTSSTTGITLEAVFTLNQYPIEFRNENNTAFTDWADGFTPDLNYDIETPYVLPESSNVSRLGYTLTGWKDAEDNVVTSVTVTVDSSLTDAYVLYPIFTPHTYNITYMLGGGSFKDGYTAPDTYGPEDTVAILPTTANINAPSDKYFLYWKIAGTSEAITEFPLFAIDGVSIVLEAVYDDEEPEDYTVTFVVDGVSTPVQVTEGTTIGTKMPADPEKLGYTFTGWYAGATPVTSATVVNGPMTVNATFRLNEYNIKYEKANGSAVSFANAPEATFDIENEYTLPVASDVDELGYTFVKWTLKGTSTVISNYDELKALITDDLTEAEGVTLVAELTLNIYSIEFKNEDGTTFTDWADGFVPDLTYDKETTYVLPVASNISNPGYTFEYWVDENGTRVDSITVTADSSLSESLVLKPYFTEHTYTIDYVFETGAGFKAGYTAPVTYGPDDTLSILPTSANIDPAEDRYFLYWKIQGQSTQITELPLFETNGETLTLVAVFDDEEPEEITVTFDVDGTLTPVQVTEDTKIGGKMPADPEKLGYTFTGWEDENGDEVTSETVITEPITVTATFRLNNYNIKYEKADGSAVNFANAPEATFDIENEYTLPVASDVDELGYVFVKWTLKGTSTVISTYDDLKALITDDLTEAEGVTLVAELTLNQYPIEFRNENNTAFTDWADGFTPVLTYNVETPYVLPGASDVDYPGYTFNGWKDAEGNEVTAVEVTASSSLSEPLVLIPRLTKHRYNIYYILETGANFKAGYTAPVNYYPGDSISILPTEDNIVPATGRYFYYWVNNATGAQITELPVFDADNSTLVLKAVFGDEEPNTSKVTFVVDGVSTPVSVQNNTAIGTKMPTDPEKLGYTFTGWEDENGDEVTSATVVTAPITATATFELNEYSIKYEKVNGDAVNFVNVPEATFDIENEYTIPVASDVDELGYTFVKWTLKGTTTVISDYDDLKALITADLTEVTLVAELTLNQYPIVFRNDDDTTFTDWADGFVPDLTYDVVSEYTLPETHDVKVLGYTLVGWMDADGNEVTSVEVTDESSVGEALVLYPILEENVYYIEYVFETGAGFVDGYTAPDTYGPNDTTAIIPDADKIAPADGRFFLYWIDQSTGDQLTELPIYEVNGETLVLEAVFDDVPPTLYTVRFFEGYNQDEDFLLGKLDDVVSGTFVAEGDIPSTDGYERTGHVKNSSIASVYATEETHKIKPTYWYVDDTNKLVPFTSEVKIVEDTDVYLLYKNFTTYMSISDEEFSVTASYEPATRLLNSIKDMALGTRQQLDKALQLDIVSGLDEKAIEKLISANILDSGNNIQKLNLPIEIGKVVKRDTINGSIKQFIRDTINNDAKLDTILDMIDIDEFIEKIDINQMVRDMSDEELRDLIKSDSYKDDVIDFILDDLDKPNSKMLDAVVDHIMSDADYKNDLIDEIITKLKNGTAEDSIIEFIKDSDKLIDMVIEGLEKGDPNLMPSAVSHIKNTLKANSTAGANLRKTVLTSNKLKDILMQAAIKQELLVMMTDKTFVNKAMENHDFRVEIVEAIVENDHFLEMLVGTEMFTKYVVENLHEDPLMSDIIELLESDSDFKKEIIAEIKTNDTFLALIKKGEDGQPDGAIRADVLEEIKFSDFVTDEDNFVAYVLGQLSDQALTDAQSEYSFITQADIENIMKEIYTGYEMEADKQAFKDYIYNNEYGSAKLEIITQAKAEFNEYAEDILNKLAKKETITDAKVNEVIDDILVEHTTMYIYKDDSLNAAEKQAIEDILVHYVGDVLCDETDTSVGTENEDLKEHVDALKLQLLEDDAKKDDVIALIDEYIEDYREEAKAILGETATYEKVVNKLITVVQADGSEIYVEVEKMLKDNVDKISDAWLEEFISVNARSEDLRNAIETYISEMSNAELAEHIKNFMTDADNEAAVREEIENYLTADKIKEYAEDFVKDPANKQDVKNEVTNFIENVSVQFVTDNRATIEDALTDMDLSGLVDKETVKEHIAGLSSADKQKFADEIYNTLIETKDVKEFIDSLLNDKTFEITEDNLSIIKAIAEALRSFEYEDVMAEINNATLNKLIDVVGEDFIKGQFNEIMDNYCDGLDEVIAQVEADGATRTYTTSLTVIVDIINDLYVPLYEKAQSKVESKIQNVFGIDFSKNPYIKFLVEDDITKRLFDGGPEYETDESTGYAIKDILDYYDYLYMLLLVADDAACWFGIDENVSDEEIDALYEAMIGKMLYAHSKVNEILETYLEEDELPARVESTLESVQQLNNAFVKVEPTLKSLINKYLKSGINENLENGDVPGVEKGEKLIDILIGQEEPVVNIDTIYNVFYYYDDTVKDKLAQVVESDKFKKAVEEFESGSLGERFKGNGKLGTLADRIDEIKNTGKVQGAFDSIYDLLVTISQYGVEPFRIEKDVITTEDAYEVKVGSVVIIIKRYYE